MAEEPSPRDHFTTGPRCSWRPRGHPGAFGKLLSEPDETEPPTGVFQHGPDMQDS